MQIKRMQVETGFLAGLDVNFTSGLNVIIGARGTGKTSVIELMRYALGAKNHTPDAEKRSIAHARAVLSDGDVELTFDQDLFGDTTVSRSIDDEAPRGGLIFDTPMMLSQTEIETIGLTSSGRLKLLDRFLADALKTKQTSASTVSTIKSTFKEILALRKEIDTLADGLEQIEVLKKQISDLEKQEEFLRASSQAIGEKQAQLTAMSSHSADLSVREEYILSFVKLNEQWVSNITEMVRGDYGVENILSEEDPLVHLKALYTQLIVDLDVVSAQFKNLQNSAQNMISVIQTERAELDIRARRIRAEIEQLSEGAGAVARHLLSVKTHLAQLQAREKIYFDRVMRLDKLISVRNEQLTELDLVRQKRCTMRTVAAKKLNDALSPQIKVEVISLAQYNEYTKALVENLRGSGLRYNELAQEIAEKISPRELIDIIENNDFMSLNEIMGMHKDRALRLVTYMRDTDLSEIATTDIDEDVNLLLLDGLEYKKIETLSAGQRCTVILSVVLQITGGVLVIDQPEDHLDNAYVASTVIKALRARKIDSQIIITTHNANIPVLGEADLIIEMTSDGRNGYVQLCKPLDTPEAVASITRVMEGGAEAFRQRSDFYKVDN